ncbi:MAG: hypothetical protein EZS28_040834 [Streblomastix strix]|uniref:Uncharacterized protein n=1 Tax=Streblomastix strix TaxID=222440 RepID=A0A5J4U0E8_9EUKA|nr:MAG: hypothetical protein EZS28_040834 [Streblomastix strix]
MVSQQRGEIRRERGNQLLSSSPLETGQSSSCSKAENAIPNHVKIELLDVILKLATTATGLEPLCILIPQLEEMKKTKIQIQ